MAIFRELPVLLSQGDPSNLESVPPRAAPLLPSEARKILSIRKPEWLKIRPPAGDNYTRIKGLLRERGLHTVCEEAHCPNVAECWATGTATFMLGGDTCTRACRFCAIKTARRPPPLDPREPYFVAESIAALKLRYVVLTSVDRDDLEDGGATHFAQTIKEIKRLDPSILVEALVPDFRGDTRAIEIVVESGLDVYAHNIETVERLQGRVRDPRAGYLQTLKTLQYAKDYAKSRDQRLLTKSSIMLGLGETPAEVVDTMKDLRTFDVEILTLGQYLRPSSSHLPVEKFLSPEEFESLDFQAKALGFAFTASGPMVRSSYKAAEFFVEHHLRSTTERNHTHGI